MSAASASRLIALTSEAESTLGREADIRLVLPQAQEACPHGLAPTTSTTMQLVLGDALAIALMESKGFTALDFSIFHPGGKLGAKLTLVRDVMHKGERIPRVALGARMSAAVVEISTKGFGCVGVFDEKGRLAGIITDGDLRRHMKSDLMAMPVAEVMTRSPRTIAADALVAEALELISHKISALLVVDARQERGRHRPFPRPAADRRGVAAGVRVTGLDLSGAAEASSAKPTISAI